MTTAGELPLTWKELMARISTRGDLAAVLISAPIGYAADIALSMTGLISPGTFGFLTACGALGAKNAIQATVDRRKAVMALPPPKRVTAADKARSAINLLKAKEFDSAANDVVRGLELFENSLVSEDDLEKIVDKAVREYQRS